MVEIRLFGGVGAVDESGEPVNVGPAKCRIVLATLALSPDSTIPVPRLIEAVWGDDPPRTADKTLQSYVTRLRKALGPDAVDRVGAAYRLNIEPEAVDVTRFQRRLADGDTQAALAEWSGPPLAGLDSDGLRASVDGLTEQWLGAIELDLERRLEAERGSGGVARSGAGGGPSVIATLTELTATHPFREGFWALLMTALYRAGRQADALAAYRSARDHLVTQLGVEPGRRLRELEALILGHDEQLPVDRPGAASGVAPTGTVTFVFAEVDHPDAATGWPRGASTALADHDEPIRAAVDAHGGHLFSSDGASLGLAFSRATAALEWAAEIGSVVDRAPRQGRTGPGLRVGVHTGEAEERSGGYFGPVVNIAARLAEAGHPGQVLVSGVAASLADRAELTDLGTFRLDGVVGEQRIHQLGSSEFPPVRIENSRRGNLPARPGRLIGRERDLEGIASALDGSAVVTLVGPGGIGKTRLALAAAGAVGAELAGGAWLVELAGISSSEDVPRAVADALDVAEGSTRSLMEALLAALRTRRTLLVLDNCEHVIDGAAELAMTVAAACPDVRILATSREGLGLDVEQLIAVSPLDPDGAGVELFNERAMAASASFDVAAERTVVGEICRRLDGVPLAIELAAARSRTLSPTDLVERLDDRLRLLTGGRRGAVERHRTLRATIQWSYDLLSVPEQILFQRLSIFAGPFDLRAAGTVAGGTELGDRAVALEPADIDDLLGGLVERSMLIVESGPFGRRFRLLETMRQFGSEHLSDSGQTDRLADRHARWCLDRVAEIGVMLAGRDEVEGVARAAELWPNLRAAFDWACATADRHLAVALVRPVSTEIFIRGQAEVVAWMERILAITPPDDEEVTVFAIAWAARGYQQRQDADGFERLVARHGEPDHPMMHYVRAFMASDTAAVGRTAPAAVAHLREQGDGLAAEMMEMVGVAGAMLSLGPIAQHDVLVGAGVERYRRHGPPSCLNLGLCMLGFSASIQNEHERAADYFEEACAVPVPSRTQGMNAPLRARAAMRHGEHRLAFELLRSFVEEMIERDNLYVTELAAIEFINMMVPIGLLDEAGRVIDHVQTTNVVPEHFFESLAGDAIQAVKAHRLEVADPDAGRPALDDDREALQFMLHVFNRLLADEQAQLDRSRAR